MKEVRSPLRYPGGKSRLREEIIPRIYPFFKEFREPFVGGGSIFLGTMQRIKPESFYKINDLNYDVYCFWKELKENGTLLIDEIFRIKNSYEDGKELFDFLTTTRKKKSDFEKAVRFFILNRITFSGTTDSGGYSEEAFHKRFNTSSIKRLRPIPKLLKNVSINHGGYEKFLFEKGDDVFIFLDPPYFSSNKSKLYGKRGKLHVNFDHEEFVDNVRKCKHKWLITYDNSKEVRELFTFNGIYFYEWEAQYGMTNVASETARKGRELMIANYPLF
ncbi:MAG: DNA adenine methylase [archaeon]